MLPPQSTVGDTLALALPLKEGIYGLSHLSHVMGGLRGSPPQWTPAGHNGPFFKDFQQSSLYPLSFKAMNVCVRRCSYVSGSQPGGL